MARNQSTIRIDPAGALDLLALMRCLALVGLLCLALLGAACDRARTRPNGSSSTAAAGTNAPILTPDRSLAGRVVRVNLQARFVVINFPLGRMPQLGQRMSLYRKGVKTAEVRISGPQMDDNIVADLIEGEAEPGDDVRGS